MEETRAESALVMEFRAVLAAERTEPLVPVESATTALV